jgi:phosphate-selective porin OprO and OprP
MGVRSLNGTKIAPVTLTAPRSGSRVVLPALAIVCIAAGSAAAQEPPASVARGIPLGLHFRLAPAPDTDQAGGKKPDPVFTWKDHPTIQRGPFRLAFRARVQADKFTSDIEPADSKDLTQDIARRRIGVEGRVANAIDFQIEYELADDDAWRDVYVNVRQFEFAQFQVGKFKQPFSVDETTGAANLDFVYRSLAASTLSPGRDVGYMVHGRAVKRIVRYEFGVFEHDGRNAKPRKADRVFGGRTKTGRIGVSPFEGSKSHLADLLVGMSFSTSNVLEGFSGIRGQSVLGAKFFDSEYWVNGKRDRRGFEVRWRPGPASVKAEWIRVTDERIGESVEDTAATPLRATGWYVSGTFAVTGDRKSDGLDNPKRPLLQGGYGAIEVAVRIESLRFDTTSTDGLPSTSPRSDVIVGNADHVTTFGVNWYANKWIKVQFNIVREKLDDASLGPLPDKALIWSRLFRIQFSL